MRHSLKLLLVTVLIFSAGAFIFSWALEKDTRTFQLCFRFITGGLLLGSLALLVWAECRKDKVPEFLRRLFKSYFERGGFCFVPIQEIDDDGVPLLWIYYQNRHANPCEAVVHLSTMRWRLRKPPLPPVQVAIACPGAAYGRSPVIWPVPADWEDRTILVGVAAEVRYPGGKGELLRYREGEHVEGIRAGFWAAAGVITAVATVGVGHAMAFASRARMKLTLPVTVDGIQAGTGAGEAEIIWPDAGEY